jgi:signal transduction histidine kinase
MKAPHREQGIDHRELAPELGRGIPDDTGTFRCPPARRAKRAAKPLDRADGSGHERAPRRLLVVGERAGELCSSAPTGSAWARVEVVVARDGDAARVALEDGPPDAVLLHLGTRAPALPLREALPRDVPVVALLEAAGDDLAAALGAEALVLCRPGESLPAAGARALEICRALLAGPPEPPGSARGHALLQETHRRLLARTVEARLGQAMVVHDLRSPLGVLRGVCAELGEAPGEVHPGLVPIMDRAVGQLEALVSRLEELHTPARPENRERLDAVELAHAIAAQTRVTAAGRHRDVVVRGEGPVYWHGDRQMLERVLLNLVGNALRHTHRRVEIRVAERHGSLRVAVLDDGPGLPAGIRADLFHRYVRDPATGRLGLGLAIVQSAVEEAGGRVRAYDRCEVAGERGPGACFVVRLPLGRAP